MTACICGGSVEVLAVASVLAMLARWIRKLVHKRRCRCRCHDKCPCEK